jgi:DnaJ-class molecular chaperone
MTDTRSFFQRWSDVITSAPRSMRCAYCNGTGQVYHDALTSIMCQNCDGTGRVPRPNAPAPSEGERR